MSDLGPKHLVRQSTCCHGAAAILVGGALRGKKPAPQDPGGSSSQRAETLEQIRCEAGRAGDRVVRGEGREGRGQQASLSSLELLLEKHREATTGLEAGERLPHLKRREQEGPGQLTSQKHTLGGWAEAVATETLPPKC